MAGHGVKVITCGYSDAPAKAPISLGRPGYHDWTAEAVFVVRI